MMAEDKDKKVALTLIKGKSGSSTLVRVITSLSLISARVIASPSLISVRVIASLSLISTRVIARVSL